MLIKLDINAGGGLINHIAIRDDKVYRFAEDGLMVYKYNREKIDILVDKILEQEYDNNFIQTIEYNIDVFKSISEDNIIKLIEELKMQD